VRAYVHPDDWYVPPVGIPRRNDANGSPVAPGFVPSSAVGALLKSKVPPVALFWK